MRWLTIDPGEDTGWNLLEDDVIVDRGTDKLYDFVTELGACTRPDVDGGRFVFVGLIVCEDWALYPWELKNLAWDKCRTARGIGAIEYIARVNGVQLELQPASIKKASVAAGAEELFARPLHENRHMNDATMHAVFYAARQGRGLTVA